MTLSATDLLQYSPAANLLDNRVVLVTGAAAGIGRAVALDCARHGATVVLLDKHTPRLEKLYDEIQELGYPQAAIYPMDLKGANWDDYLSLASNIETQLGKLDALVLNAGDVVALTPFSQTTPQRYQEVMTVNLHAPYLMVQACLPLLRQSSQASIVFSTHKASRAYWGPFGIAKAGLEGLLDILAHEFSGEHQPVRVNGIDTGPVDTKMRRDLYPGEDWSRLRSAAEVTPAYLYFIGDDCRTTGVNLQLPAKP